MVGWQRRSKRGLTTGRSLARPQSLASPRNFVPIVHIVHNALSRKGMYSAERGVLYRSLLKISFHTSLNSSRFLTVSHASVSTRLTTSTLPSSASHAATSL